MIVALDRGLPSLVITIEEVLERKSSGSGLENTPLSAKVGTNFADKRRSLGQYSSFTDSGHCVCVSVIPYARLCGLVVRVPGYRTEMYCVSCEVRTEFICYVEESRPPLWPSGQSS
jgi:hypothetical protein